jgi:predicted transposase YbfD/YdcC
MTRWKPVPADPSCSVPAALTQLAQAGPLGPAEGPHLLAYLATIHDPRRACGRRHPLVAILAMAAAAVLAGARSVTAIAEWAADTPQPVRAALAARRDAPDRWVVPAEATIRRTLGRVDPTALAAVIGTWLTDRDHPSQRRRAVAIDGKTLRGARRDGRQVHLLAAMDHATRAVLAQRHVEGAPGEVPGLAPLLANLDLAGAVVTADALHTHADADEFLVTGKQAHYLFTVKANQPTLLDRCARLAWHHVPVLDRTRDRAHGRVELRTLKAVSVRGFGFPHAAQVVQVTRKTRELGTRRWRAGRLRDHQPGPRSGQPSSARRPAAGALGDRERPALRPRCDLRRGRLPAARRDRPVGHSLPAQPCHRRAQPRRAGQPRRRLTPARPRPTPTPHHPRHCPRMKRALPTQERRSLGAGVGPA